MENKIIIKFEEWDHNCNDGCCFTYGTRLIMDGEELEHPNPEIHDNSYVGDSPKDTLHAVLKKLGYTVIFE